MVTLCYTKDNRVETVISRSSGGTTGRISPMVRAYSIDKAKMSSWRKVKFSKRGNASALLARTSDMDELSPSHFNSTCGRLYMT